MSVQIRDAVAADEARCRELLAALQSATGNRHAEGRQDTLFTDLLTQARGQVIVACEDDVILGMATVSYNLALRYAGEYCQLEELIVDPLARGKNVGGQLVQATIDNARARGCGEYGLYLVATTEHNRPFYEKYGFKTVGNEMRMSLA